MGNHKLSFAIPALSVLALVSYPASASTLSTAADGLQPGESVMLNTALPGTMLSPDDADFLQWSSSGVWDPIRGEARFIGKRHSVFPMHFLVYDEATNTWSANRRMHPDLEDTQSGHGYDHNTGDPATGDHYFRTFGTHSIYRWNGSTWSVINIPSGYVEVAASISWIPQLGLVYVDNSNFAYYNGTWHDLNGGVPGGMTSYHTSSEYNYVANVLIFGGGNDSSAMWKYDVSANRVSQIATPPFNLGSSSSQGVLIADPGSEAFIGWRKTSTQWTEYDVDANQWTSIPVSTGNGSVPARGTPNLDSSGGEAQATIGIPINTYGVIMYVQYRGDSRNAGVWLYKHSSSVRPLSPTNLTALP